MLKSSVLQAIAQAKQAVQDLVFRATHVRRGEAVHVPGSAPNFDEELQDVSVFFSRYSAKEIDGDRVLATDWVAISFPEAGSTLILPNDIIEVTSTVNDVEAGKYRVIMNEPVMVGNSVALNQMQLRLL